MHRSFSFLLLGVAAASLLAGAVIAVFPALIVGLVHLFYDSAGGVLILLGSLISLLPHPAGAAGQGSSSLPAFQTLETGGPIVLIRSILGTALCGVSLALLLGGRHRKARMSWLAAELCCILAGIVGGIDVALALIPALLAIAIGLLTGRVAGV